MVEEVVAKGIEQRAVGKVEIEGDERKKAYL